MTSSEARSSRWASSIAIVAIARMPSTSRRTSGVGGGFDARSGTLPADARIVALAWWWTLFGHLADPDRHREANHQPAAHDARHRAAHQRTGPHHPTITVAPTAIMPRCAGLSPYRSLRFGLRSTAEQLSPTNGLYRILSEAMKKFLRDSTICARRHSA